MHRYKIWEQINRIFAILLAILLAHVSSVFGSSAKELNVVSWGGAYTAAEKKAFYDPFEEKSGIKINTITAMGAELWGKLRAQAKSGNIEWDVLSTRYHPSLLSNKDLIEKVDYSIVKNTEDLIKNAVGEYYIGGTGSLTAITYNKETFPGGSHPKSWREFWDVKNYPGSRSLPNYGSPEETIAFALIADGVSPDKLLPFDYERAFKKLNEIKPHILVWWTNGSQYQQIFRDKEVVLAPGWDGRVFALQKQNFPIGIEYNQGYYTSTSWAVVKGTKHKDLAMRLLNFVIDPKRQANFTKEFGLSPTNTKAFDYLDDSAKDKLATSPKFFKKFFTLDPVWLSDHKKEITEKWQTWIAK